MREIKFDFVFGIDGKPETYFTRTFDFGEIENGCHWQELCDSPLLKDYTILGKRQYTGLKDKNGKEIYEGDIICKDRELKEVKWDINMFTISRISWVWEVIGNIYEHGELLDAG